MSHHDLSSIPHAVDVIAILWHYYFPKEVFNPVDARLGSIAILLEVFENELEYVLSRLDQRRGVIRLHAPYILSKVPFEDFRGILVTQPNEVLGCMGLAVSLLLVTHEFSPRPRPIYIVLFDLSHATPFYELKSNTVGQLVTVVGYVVKVAAARPLVTAGSFKCSKCGKYTRAYFDDGMFMPPSACSTDKCYNRYLELDRNSIVLTDYQRIKVQEMEDREAARAQAGTTPAGDPSEASSHGGYNPRVPRTFDIEVRGAHLVDQCVAGDVLLCVGEVKMMQSEAPRGGRGRGAERESGIHHIYIVANSLRTTRADEGMDRPVSSAGGGKRTVEDIANDDDATVADIYRATKIHKSAAADEHGNTKSGVPRNNVPSALQLIESIGAAGQDTVPWLINSLCPLIFGHELVKLGLLLGLFGGKSSGACRGDNSSLRGRNDGTDPSIHGSFSTRSDIHVLVVGDPGLGKSQLLRSAAAVAPKAVFVCGNTATTAGLTVSLSRESGGSSRGGGGGDVCIEAGALVLADRGVCCIDELDKMTCDPHSMLEAMEQQQISIAKSGVVTSLKARSTILAAANPVGGHYNRNKSVCENLKMASALLSRFDLVFILLDRADEDHDRRISEHIMGITRASQRTSDQAGGNTGGHNGVETEEQGMDTLSQRLRKECARCADRRAPLDHVTIRRYIEHARRNVSPRLSPAAAKVLQKMYLTMRSRGAAGDGIDSAASGAMPVTTRHLESLIRLAQARARMELRDLVTEDDASDVVSLLQESILDTLTSELGVVDIGRKGGMSLAKQVKAVVAALGRQVSAKGSNVFTQKEIGEVYASLRLPSLSTPKHLRGASGQMGPIGSASVSSVDVESIIEVMRSECYVILKGPRLYQLQLH